MEHRKKRKIRKCKLKLGKTLAENAETAEFTLNFQLLSTFNSKLSTLLCHVSHVLHGFGKLKLGFFKHELSLINHELTINGWRGLLFLRVIALRIENPYNSLRQIANLPQRSAVLRLKAN